MIGQMEFQIRHARALLISNLYTQPKPTVRMHANYRTFYKYNRNLNSRALVSSIST